MNIPLGETSCPSTEQENYEATPRVNVMDHIMAMQYHGGAHRVSTMWLRETFEREVT